MRLVSIVEGHGDVASISALIGKISAHTSIPLYPIKSIRTGGWSHLQRAGELERYLELALSHQPDRVLILSDLDDHCPVDESKKFRAVFDQSESAGDSLRARFLIHTPCW